MLASSSRKVWYSGGLLRDQEIQLHSPSIPEGIEPTQAHAKQQVERGCYPFPCPRPGSMRYNLSWLVDWGTNYAKKGRSGSLHFAGKRHEDDIHSATKKKHGPPVSV